MHCENTDLFSQKDNSAFTLDLCAFKDNYSTLKCMVYSADFKSRQLS